MSTRKLWLLSVLGGLLVIGVGLITLGQFPTEGAGYAEGYGAPVYAFEMARTKADLVAVFGAADDPARTARIAAMDAGNLWDYPFMLVYGLFIAVFFAAAARQSGSRAWLVFAALGIIASLSDAVENQILLGLTDDLEAAPMLELLRYPVWIKFLSLMVCGVAAGLFILKQGGMVWRVLGAVAALTPLLIIPGAIDPSSYGIIMGNGLTICWIVKLAYAGVSSMKEATGE